MAEIDVQNDLDAVNNQIETFAEELRKIDAARENIVTQITNLQGVSMYLRGKITTDNENVVEEISEEETFERTAEYPTEDKT
tara:strand:- start:988 stop:1233 length:246 start_codon:yes stop_codon:yes gene_type:complete